jgi:serine/threonine protein kinase
VVGIFTRIDWVQADFDVAKSVAADGTYSHSNDPRDDFVGTPDYISPEIIRVGLQDDVHCPMGTAIDMCAGSSWTRGLLGQPAALSFPCG